MFTSKLLRINSKYRTSTSASNTDFQVVIASKDLENISKCVLVSATIPRLMTNIYPPFNFLYGVLNMGVNLAFEIPVGQYTAEALALVIAAKVRAVVPSVIITYDEILKRFKFEATDPAVTVLLFPDSIGQLIGISSPGLTIQTNNPQAIVYAQGPTSLQGPSVIYVQSQFVSNRNCLDILENGLSIPLVIPLKCNKVPYGFDISYVSPNEETFMINYTVENTGSVNLRSIDIRLVDMFGNQLFLPPNFNVDLVFKVFKVL